MLGASKHTFKKIIYLYLPKFLCNNIIKTIKEPGCMTAWKDRWVGG